MRNLALALFRHERIITTEAKAKHVRPFIEKLITMARKGTLHARRLVLARLGPPSKAEVHPLDQDNEESKEDTRTIITKLFTEIAPRYASRPGGYTRIVKRHQRRLGDGGKTAYLELLKAGEVKVQKQSQAPPPTMPAPRVTETPPPVPETPPAQASAPASQTPAAEMPPT